jgi:hypothetical protein
LSTGSVAKNPGVFLLQHDFKNAVTQQWSLTLEHQFANDWMARASYTGSQAHHVMWAQGDINRPLIQIPNKPLQDQRPWQPWSTISVSRSGGKQDIEQLQLELTKRFTHSLMAQVEYSWTRSLDNAPWDGAPMIWQNPNLGYGNTERLRRHYLVANFVYELPFGKGRHWLSGASRAPAAGRFPESQPMEQARRYRCPLLFLPVMSAGGADART